jgi:hypothetical protein
LPQWCSQLKILFKAGLRRQQDQTQKIYPGNSPDRFADASLFGKPRPFIQRQGIHRAVEKITAFNWQIADSNVDATGRGCIKDRNCLMVIGEVTKKVELLICSSFCLSFKFHPIRVIQQAPSLRRSGVRDVRVGQ